MTQKPHSLEYTALLASGEVFHYTCNPPKEEVLDKYNIKPIGNSFNCTDNREVLLIPSNLYKKFGYVIRDSDLKIVSEVLLRRLG